MNLTTVLNIVKRTLRDNSPTILTALGISGTLSTAYLASKASFKAARVIDECEKEDGYAMDRRSRLKHRTKLVWKLYIPASVSAGLTVGCMISSTRIGTKRAAAAYSLLTVSEKAFTEYKEKVVEQIGEKKEKAIRDEIAQDRVNKSSEQGALVVVASGNVLCYEMHTGRYFNCDMETLRKAQNTINAKLFSEMEATLSDFYYLVKLPYTSYSSDLGWHSDKMLELSFSTVMSEDGRPCIAFEYNYTRSLYGIRE